MSYFQKEFTHGLPNQAQYRIEWFFDHFQIPLPEKDQAYSSNTKLTFINPAGVTLRIDFYGKNPLVRHPLLLRPLGAISLNHNLRLEMHQGGSLNTSINETDMYQQLLDDGLQITDVRKPNICRILPKNEESSQGTETLFDPQKIKITPESKIQEIKANKDGVFDVTPVESQKPDLQDKYFGQYRRLFTEALKDKNEGVERLWKACIQARIEGKFVNGWLEPDTTVETIGKQVPETSRN